MTAVPCSSDGSTSGSWVGCLGPEQCPKGTCGKQRRKHVTATPDTRAGPAQQDMRGSVLWPLSHQCLREPSKHHPHGPLPIAPPIAGKYKQVPLKLEKAGWKGKPLPLGGLSQPPGFTCEIRRNSCAFCRQDENSGLWCAPAWKRKRLSHWLQEPVWVG